MKRGLLVILAICAFAIAMVPKDRRAGNTEEQKEIPQGDKMVCDIYTPCAWFVYRKHQVNVIEYNLTNVYCSCGSGTSCVKDEDDEASNAYVYRCREPEHDQNITDN